MGSLSHLWSVFCRNFVTILPYYQNLRTSLRLIISKIVRAKSPLFSLLPLRYSDIIALLYKNLDIGSRLSF